MTRQPLAHLLPATPLAKAAFVLLSAAVALCIGLQAPKQDPKDLRATTVRAQGFVLEDDSGKPVARLQTTAKGTAFEFLTKDGKTGLLLGCSPSGEVAIQVKNSKGEVRAGLRMDSKTGEAGLWVQSAKGLLSISALDDEPPVLRVHGKSRADLLLLGVRQVRDQEDAAMVLRSAKGNLISLSATGNGRTLLAMTDTQGAPRILGTVADSKSTVTIWDASQKSALGLIGLQKGQVALRIRDRLGKERFVLGTDSDDNTDFLVRSKDGKVIAGESK